MSHPYTCAPSAARKSSGTESGACVHLEAYVREHPDQPVFRIQLAELLLKTSKPDLARFHLEIDAVHHPAAAVALDEATHFQKRHVRSS